MQKATLTKEERQQRIKESRQKYGRRPPRRSRSLEQVAPRVSIAPGLKTAGSVQTKPLTRPVPFNFNHNVKGSRTINEEDFKIDHQSMEMIKSGNVVIPRANRPSNFGFSAPRNTLHANRFRASIAAAQEPRASLLPLGINIFQATEAERALVNDWMKQKATPAGKKTASEAMKSSQKVRFQPVEEDSDEKPSSEEKIHPKPATPFVHKFNTPNGIRSVLKNTEIQNSGLATARKLNFDDTTFDESAKENSLSAEKGDTVGEKLRNIHKLAESLSNHKFTPSELKDLNNCLDLLQSLKSKQMIEKPRQLVPISEDGDDEEEEELSSTFETLQLKARFVARRLPDL